MFPVFVPGSLSRLIRQACLSWAVAAATVTPGYAQLTRTWNGTTGNWNTASRWSPTGVPNNGNGGNNYNANINAGSVNVNTAIVVNGLNFSGGAIIGSSPLTVVGPTGLNWTGGDFAGNGLTTVNSGTIDLTAFGYGYLDRNMTIAGNVNWGSGYIHSNNVANSFAISGGSTLTASGSSDRYLHQKNISVGAGSTFTNSNAAITDLYAGANFVNNGTVNVNAGTLRIASANNEPGSGSGTGAFNVASGTALEFFGGDHTYTGIIQGAGTTRFSAGTVNVDNNYSMGTATDVHSGQANFNSGYTSPITRVFAGEANFNNVPNRTLVDVELSSGSIGGDSNLVLDNLNWNAGGGGIVGSGSTTVNGGTIDLAVYNYGYLDRDVTIAGNVNWSSGYIYTNNIANSFSISGGSTLTASGSSDRYLHQKNITVGAGSTFTNSNAATTDLYAGADFVNNGTVNVNTGTLRIASANNEPGSGSGAGAFNVASGAALEFFGGDHTYTGIIQGAGTTRFSAGTVNVDNNYSMGTATEVHYGQANFNSGYMSPITKVFAGEANFNNVPNRTLVDVELGTGYIGGNSNLVLNNLNWNAGGGGLVGSGSTTVNGGTIDLAVYNYGYLDRDVTIAGNVNWSSGYIYTNNIASSFAISGGSTLTSSGSSDRYLHQKNISVGAGSTFTNSNAATTDLYAGANFVNNGTVNVNAGTLRIASANNEPGSGSGAGAFNVASGTALEFFGGDHTYTGIIQGAGTTRFSAGTVNVENNYSMGTATEVHYGQTNFNSGYTSPITKVFSGQANFNSAYTSPITKVFGGEANFNNVANRTLADVELGSGYIGGNSNLVLNNLNWNTGGGGLVGSGSTTIDGGMIDLAVYNYGYLDRDTTIAGNVNWSSGYIYTNSFANSFAISGGSTLTASGSSDRYLHQKNISVGAGSTFTNTNAATTDLYAGANFVNNGTVNVNAGTLRIASANNEPGSGSGTGAFNVASGTALEFFGGDHTYTGIIQGAGTTRFSAGTVNVENNYSMGTATEVHYGQTNFNSGYTSPITKVFSGQANFNSAYTSPITKVFGGEANFNNVANRTLADVELGSGYIGGNSNLVLNNLNWNAGGGGLLGSGSTTVNGGTIDLAVYNYGYLDRDMTIAGNVNWSSGYIYSNAANAFTIANGGTFSANGSSDRYIQTQTVAVNAGGSLVKNGSGVLDVYSDLTNNGRIVVNTGTLQLQGGFTNFAGTTLTGGTYDVARTLKFNGANIKTNQAEIILNGTNALIRNESNSNAIGALATNGANGKLRIRASKVLGSTSNVTNSGLVEIDGGASQLNLTGTGGLQGVYRQTVGETHLVAGGTLQSTKGIKFDGGTLTGNGNLKVTGIGTTDFAASSIISPGDSVGILNIYSDTTIGGTLAMEVEGIMVDNLFADPTEVNFATNATTTDFDQINVLGNLSILSGTVLNVSLINAFTPSNGDFFDLITANNMTVDLNQLVVSFPSGGNYSLSVLNLNDPVRGNTFRDVLRLSYSSVVPEPGTFTALAIMMIAGQIRLRRRVPDHRSRNSISRRSGTSHRQSVSVVTVIPLLLVLCGLLVSDQSLHADTVDQINPGKDTATFENFSKVELPAKESASEELPQIQAAIESLRVRDLAKARTAIESIPNADASNPEIILAQLLASLGLAGDASNVLETLSTKPEHAFESHMLFAEIAVGQSRWFDAMTHAVAAEKEKLPKRWSPKRQSESRLRLTLIKGAASEGRGDYATAEGLYDGAEKSSPDAIGVLSGSARTKFQLGKVRDAQGQLIKLRKLNPSLPLPEVSLAQLYNSQSKLDEAEKAFRAALKSTEQPARSQAVLAYADWLLFQNRAADADRILDDNDFDQSLNSNRLFNKALSARMQQEYPQAQQLLSTLHQTDSASFPISNQLALVLIENSDEALRARALQIAEANVRNNQTLAEAWSTLGWIQFRLGDLASAEKNLATAMQSGTASRDTVLFMAKVKARLGQTELASQLASAGTTAVGPVFSQVAKTAKQ